MKKAWVESRRGEPFLSNVDNPNPFKRSSFDHPPLIFLSRPIPRFPNLYPLSVVLPSESAAKPTVSEQRDKPPEQHKSLRAMCHVRSFHTSTTKHLLSPHTRLLRKCEYILFNPFPRALD